MSNEVRQGSRSTRAAGLAAAGLPRRGLARTLDSPAFKVCGALVGRRFTAALRELEQAQWLSPAELQARAAARLAPLLRHAAEHVPFYQDTYRRLGLAPGELRTLDDLRRLPVVNKAMHREHPPDHFIAAHLPGYRRVQDSTSGSTGEPFWFYLDREAAPRVFASHLFLDSWYDLGPFARSLRFHTPSSPGPPLPAGTPVPVRLREAMTARLRALYKARTQAEILGWDIDTGKAEAIFRRLEAFRPAYVTGYTSILAALADEWDRRDLRLSRTLRAVIVCGETLSDPYRQLIQRFFAAPLINRYGLRELGAWSAQNCPCAPEQLHVNSELVVWETVRDDGTPAAPGETGRVLLTDLHNQVMPFIRYDTGDLARMGGAPCACGRGLPVVAQLLGRTQESLRTPSGKVLMPAVVGYLLFNFQERVDTVRHFQLVQEARDRVRLLVVPAPGFAEEQRARLTANLARLLGEEVAVSVETVAEIRRETSGKRPVIKGIFDG